LKAKSENASELGTLLENDGPRLIKGEPETVHWFGVKMEEGDGNDFAVMDTFTSDAAKQVHINGELAALLMEKKGCQRYSFYSTRGQD
jgi:hypothetical protein